MNKLFLHETKDNPTSAVKRTLISIKIDSDEKMIAFHDFMVGGFDIITQIEINGICYALVQKLTPVPLKEVMEAEKAEAKAKKKKGKS